MLLTYFNPLQDLDSPHPNWCFLLCLTGAGGGGWVGGDNLKIKHMAYMLVCYRYG